jgi:hypothetical protein
MRGKKPEFSWSQTHLSRRTAHAAIFSVERQFADRNDKSLCVRPRPPQQRANPGDELKKGKGFDDIIVRAKLQTANAVPLIRASAQHD